MPVHAPPVTCTNANGRRRRSAQVTARRNDGETVPGITHMSRSGHCFLEYAPKITGKVFISFFSHFWWRRPLFEFLVEALRLKNSTKFSKFLDIL